MKEMATTISNNQSLGMLVDDLMKFDDAYRKSEASVSEEEQKNAMLVGLLREQVTRVAQEKTGKSL